MSFLRDALIKLSQAHGISGSEENVRDLVMRAMKKFVDEIQTTPLGSVIGIKRAGRRRVRGRSTPRVLIEAHMDEIGLMVTGIEAGFIRFDTVGSFDPRVLPSQTVVVHGRQALPGVIGTRPPHVLSAEERKKPIPLKSLFIDVGLPDARARELISIGDPITFDRAVTPLHNNHFTGKAFDDRAALAVLLDALRQLREVELAWDLYAVANVNEEQSAVYIGALTSTFQLCPDLAIALDVTHAEQPGVPDFNVAQLGQGPCIALGANVHPFVHRKLVQAAQDEAIPYRVTVYGGDTETNAWMMQVAAGGVPTGLIELPLRYMHTSVEMLQLDDLAHAAELVKTFTAALDAADYHALQGETFVRAATRPHRHARKPTRAPSRVPTSTRARKARATLARRRPSRHTKPTTHK